MMRVSDTVPHFLPDSDVLGYGGGGGELGSRRRAGNSGGGGHRTRSIISAGNLDPLYAQVILII